MKKKRVLPILLIFLFCTISGAEEIENLVDNKFYNKINEISQNLSNNISNSLKDNYYKLQLKTKSKLILEKIKLIKSHGKKNSS